jgi:predicted type IV restriction endonuclease
MKSGKIYHSYSEEWVRQHVVDFIGRKKNTKSLINVEKVLKSMACKRYDVVVFNSDGSIFILINAKRQSKNCTSYFDQIARYNMMNAQYLMVTNGLNHYFCQMDFENEKYQFL